ncbi:mannose-6-phosphate isomerase [Ilyomonas limi]|uniref:Mannose-6-phosphate isomerase n=1 Tax=Ilyomonas limi TaxID=2575867 RepID=A0A4U3LCS1_9BACT|nr:class I mannose-6-phosphate isomerase [Ilyomonas limi]TKK71866.1 mannose-6-phosphate isomerase [Ilyomonas limi]
MKKSNFDKAPYVAIDGHRCTAGWEDITDELSNVIFQKNAQQVVVAVDCYHGVYVEEIAACLQEGFPAAQLFYTLSAMRSNAETAEMVFPFVTDDPVFGYITPLELKSFFSEQKTTVLQQQISAATATIIFVIGYGATLIAPDADLIVYADMPRWEIQLRFRNKNISNLGADNTDAEFSYQYKRSFFVDWRVLDRHKRTLLNRWDFVLDTTIPGRPKMITGKALQEALAHTVERPFRVVPFFDPGPWGGQWLKEVCDLDDNQPNYAWGFDCVPEENSLLFRFGEVLFETPAINLVFAQPEKLLGKKVYQAFGAEFPIRFDFLDTIEGGNLSLQVHPLREYIREKFGMGYTQDESYYILDARENAFVYLGLKEDINKNAMLHELHQAQEKGGDFDAEKYVAKWTIKKHDHILIPAGTIHCSGADTVVLEISATPYIFTFKLWDWGRMGLDGKPRPISLEHGKNVIQWNRTSAWTKEHIINQFERIGEGDGWIEERTGLDATSFIETRRHWFTKKVAHNTNGIVNVLNLIEGREAIIESPSNAFEPYIIHYAETFIVPANVGAYTIRPYGESDGQQCATIKAFVRTDNLTDYRIN